MQDIYDHMDKQEPIDFTKVYDPLRFWDDYGDKYYKDHKKPEEFMKYVPYLLNHLKVLKVDTLYNAGCGFCRIEPFLLEGKVVKKITSVDISQKQLDAAEEYLKDSEFRENIDIKKQTVKWSKFPHDNWDCTLSVECLQHLPPPTVYLAIKQLVDVAKKYIIIVERFAFAGEHPAPHLWSHDYASLFVNKGVKLMESVNLGNGMVGMVFKK